MADALAILASKWENLKKLTMGPLVLAIVSKPSYEVGSFMDVEWGDGKPRYYDIENFLDLVEFPEEVGKKDMMVI